MRPQAREHEPARVHIVLVGGGHAHVGVIRAFGMAPPRGAVVTVVTRELEAPYSGMLPGFVAGHYTYDECHIDLVRLCAWAGVRLIHGTVEGIDRRAKRIAIAGRASLGYDLTSIDVGITPQLDAIAGAAQHGIAVKPVSTFAARWRALEQVATATSGPRRIAVVGTGAAGFELVLAARHRFLSSTAVEAADRDRFSFTLIGGSQLLASHNARAQRLARRQLARQGVELIENCRVAAIDERGVTAQDGRRIDADAVLFATNAGPAAWFKESGLPVDARGFIAVRPTLQLTDDDDVFAVGDCATVLEHPREKAGVFAVRQGPPLTENLLLRARGERARPFVPQSQFLTLLSTGPRHAIAARNGLAVAGKWVWSWKDRIDRQFMDMFNELPFAAAADDEAGPRCAGCAAKVGPVTLARALDRLAPGAAGARDDAAVFDAGEAGVRLETIDFFRAVWPEPYLFGEIAANHATSDVFAMGGRPTHALANVVLPHASPERTEEDLYQFLAGAQAALARDGVTIAGGHSSEGAELAAGFFVSGTAVGGQLVRKGGLKPGDRLVLTRPLGTAILFAGLMRGRARGRDIAVVLEWMRRSNGAAARVLNAHGACAMTDVTGFGLAGHLIEMLDASGCGAALDVAHVPLYAGVAQLARNGVASTLMPENLRRADRLRWAAPAADGVLAVLFDPQTSGGLLAALPGAAACDALAALRESGESGAAIIGEVTAGDALLAVSGALADQPAG